MRKIITVDCETDPFEKGRINFVPFIWGVYDGCTYRYFEKTGDFIDYIKNIDCVVYAHNGGKFDYFFIYEYLKRFDDLLIINGRLSKFTIGLAEFRDSLNILPFPLSAYKKDTMDYSIMSEEKRYVGDNYDKIKEYLRKDCIYLYELVDKFVKNYGENITIASSAFKKWQKISKTKPPKTNKNYYNQLKKYYYGGRVECFETGIINRNFYVVDINSAYPDAMMYYHPWGQSYDVDSVLPKKTHDVQRCFITLECVSKGALPFRDKNLTFPNDGETREYNITGWEYLSAIDTNTIEDVKIKKVVSFAESINFENYVNHFYSLKKESKKTGDKKQYLFSKLFLNSLYGKFGANPEKYKSYTIIEPQYIQAAENEGYEFCVELGPWALCYKQILDEESHYYDVAVAASITGFVRAKMWRALCSVKNPIYCDTDSIACDDVRSLELDSNKLGAWDVEANCHYGAIGGKKLYAFMYKKNGLQKSKIACKGVKLSAKQIIDIAKGEVIDYTPIAPCFSLKSDIHFITRKVRRT